MNCSSIGNPNPLCKWTFCRENRACESFSEVCLSNLTIDSTGSVVCNGTNVLGSVSSNATSFVVVPNSREYEHLGSSNNTSHRCVKTKLMYCNRKTLRDCGWKCHNQCYKAARTGSELALHYWLFPWIANKHFLEYGNTVWGYSLANKTFKKNLTRNAIGNYTCKTSDLFGNYSTTISVDVLCKLIGNFNVVEFALCLFTDYLETWNCCVSIVNHLKVVAFGYWP